MKKKQTWKNKWDWLEDRIRKARARLKDQDGAAKSVQTKKKRP